MTHSKRDPLLTAAKILLYFLIGVIGFAALMVTIGLPFVIIYQDRILMEATAKGVTAGPELIGAIALIMLGIAVLLGLAIYFLDLLRRIVNTVEEGDPFVPQNAERLSRMGWTALAGNLFAIPVGGLVLWIATLIEDTPAASDMDMSSDVGFSGEGLLLILVLFILARVFRKGTEMREELEGTV